MAEITPLSFYNPYQPTTGDLNQLLPDWFFNSTPMTANQAITANAQATSAQAQAEANAKAMEAQNAIEEIIKPGDSTDIILSKAAGVFGKAGQIDEMTKALNTLIAKQKAERPEVMGSVSSGLYQKNPDGSIVVLAPPQRSRTPQYTTVYGPNGQPQMVPKDPNVVNPMYQQGYTSEAPFPFYTPSNKPTSPGQSPAPTKRIVRGTVKRQ